MSTIYDIPEPILHDILSILIDVTRYKGWQMSLRLVNRCFNDALIHVYYLRKRLLAVCDTVGGACSCVFNFQSFLARRDIPRDSIADQYWHRWHETLVILRDRNFLQQEDLSQGRFRPIVSNNGIFGDIFSPVLTRAVCSFATDYANGITDIEVQMPLNTLDPLRSSYEVLPVEFWLVLSACVAGDLQLLEDFVDEMDSMAESVLFFDWPEWRDRSLHVCLLETALRNEQLPIINYLLKKNPKIMSTDGAANLLHIAIFCENEAVLHTLLRFTSHSSELLAEGLKQAPLLAQSNNGSRTIKVLVEHFSPLSAESRRRLIKQACAVGDLALLDEFSKIEPLYTDYDVDVDNHQLCFWLVIAARFGHVACVRFLLDQSAEVPGIYQEVQKASGAALRSNHIQCYELLYQSHQNEASNGMYKGRFGHRSIFNFDMLAMADGAKGVMKDFASRFGSLAMTSPLNYGVSLSKIAQYALNIALMRLRASNARFLLEAGVRVPDDVDGSNFEVSWSRFNRNREAYAIIQDLLREFSMPELTVVV